MLCCLTGPFFSENRSHHSWFLTMSIPQSLKANIGLSLIWYVLSWEHFWFSGLRFKSTKDPVLWKKSTFWCLLQYSQAQLTLRNYPHISSVFLFCLLWQYIVLRRGEACLTEDRQMPYLYPTVRNVQLSTPRKGLSLTMVQKWNLNQKIPEVIVTHCCHTLS